MGAQLSTLPPSLTGPLTAPPHPPAHPLFPQHRFCGRPFPIHILCSAWLMCLLASQLCARRACVCLNHSTQHMKVSCRSFPRKGTHLARMGTKRGGRPGRVFAAAGCPAAVQSALGDVNSSSEWAKSFPFDCRPAVYWPQQSPGDWQRQQL